MNPREIRANLISQRRCRLMNLLTCTHLVYREFASFERQMRTAKDKPANEQEMAIVRIPSGKSQFSLRRRESADVDDRDGATNSEEARARATQIAVILNRSSIVTLSKSRALHALTRNKRTNIREIRKMSLHSSLCFPFSKESWLSIYRADYRYGSPHERKTHKKKGFNERLNSV